MVFGVGEFIKRHHTYLRLSCYCGCYILGLEELWQDKKVSEEPPNITQANSVHFKSQFSSSYFLRGKV